MQYQVEPEMETIIKLYGKKLTKARGRKTKCLASSHFCYQQVQCKATQITTITSWTAYF